MGDKKDCGCKVKQNADRLVKNIEEINKSSSVSYVKKNKNYNLNKIIYKLLKVIVYIIGFLLLAVFILPIIIYAAFSKKPLKIKFPNISKK